MKSQEPQLNFQCLLFLEIWRKIQTQKKTNASELKNSHFLDASESVEFYFFYCHRDLQERVTVTSWLTLYGLLQLNTKSERKSPPKVQGFFSQALCWEDRKLGGCPASLKMHHCTVLTANICHYNSTSYSDFCYFLHSIVKNLMSSSVMTLTMQS